VIGSAGTTAYVPNPRVNYASSTPTGGWGYDDGTHYGDYTNSYAVRKPEPPNPLKDPKNWALWFREFLALVFPRVRMEVLMPPEPILKRLAYRCRSGTIPIREWKMKNWVQALNQQI
jgi:hypothetical protein